jgi:hypothetical protein
MTNICPLVIGSTDAKGETTLGLIKMLKSSFGEGSFDGSIKEEHWAQFFTDVRDTALLCNQKNIS